MEASSAGTDSAESATQNDKVLPQNAAISHAFVGAKSKSCFPPACNLQLTQVNRRSKYWTKAGIKLYICPASLLIVIAQVKKSYFLPGQILLLHSHTHTNTHTSITFMCAFLWHSRHCVAIDPFFRESPDFAFVSVLAQQLYTFIMFYCLLKRCTKWLHESHLH